MLIHSQSLFNIENRFCFWSNNNVPFIIQLKLHFSTSNVEVCVFLESRIIDLESIERNPEEIIAKLNKIKKKLFRARCVFGQAVLQLFGYMT